MQSPQLRQFSVRQIHHRLAERVFAVPKLQREFVWDGRKAAALLDSMYKSMPIGMILVWETRRKHYDLLRQSLHILPPFNTDNSYGLFLIDGQQRLSVLHEAFEGGIKQNSSEKTIDFGRLCFVVEPDVEEYDPQRFVYRKPVARRFVAVQDILSPNWRRRLVGYTKPLLKRVGECRERILSYRVPMVIVDSNDLEEIREIFLRINSQGMKISSADRAFARASKVDLRNLAHELRFGINREFHDLDFNAILQGFTFVTSERELDVGQRALEATIRWWERQIDVDGQESAFYKRWHNYRKAFGKAVDYLHANFGVINSGFLPSVNMVATLSVFFFHHTAAPNTKQRAEIRKWFWATGVGQRYSGRGYRINLIEDVRFFERLARRRAPFRFAERVDPLDVSRAEYTQRSALTNALYCLLSKCTPRYIANGEPIPSTTYASRANRSDRHHIFPRALLANYGFNHREYNSICNICFIVAEENQAFGMKRPDRYLEGYFNQRHFAKTMKSHLIPYGSDSGLFTSGVRQAYKQFRRKRLQVICRAFESEAGIKLFRK